MTPQTTKIIRYSTQGFKPQYQSEHLKMSATTYTTSI